MTTPSADQLRGEMFRAVRAWLDVAYPDARGVELMMVGEWRIAVPLAAIPDPEQPARGQEGGAA